MIMLLFCCSTVVSPSFSLSRSRLCPGCQTTKRLIYSRFTDGDTLGSFRRGNVEHVLLNSVTGEAAPAGQGAQRALGEPCLLTKETEHLGCYSSFSPCLPSCSDSPHNPHFHYFPSPFGCTFLLFNKTVQSLYNRGFIMSYFPHSYNPFKHATSSQPILSDIHPATQSAYQSELLWVIVRSRGEPQYESMATRPVKCLCWLTMQRGEKRLCPFSERKLSEIPSFPKIPCFLYFLSMQNYNSVIILAGLH